MTGRVLAQAGEKYCHKCSTSKPVDMFSKDRSKPGGVRSRCKQCDADYAASNRERISQYNAGYHRRNQLSITSRQKRYRQEVGLSIKMHNITIDDYEELLEAQDGHCADCPMIEGSRSGGRLEIDHDHKHCEKCDGTWACGRASIRALVCSSCNKFRKAGDHNG